MKIDFSISQTLLYTNQPIQIEKKNNFMHEQNRKNERFHIIVSDWVTDGSILRELLRYRILYQ